jgi:hypothetical protein
MANSDALIEKCKSKYDVEMQKESKDKIFSFNEKGLNTSSLQDNTEYIILNTFGHTKENNPLLKNNLNDIALYQSNIFEDANNKKPFDMFLYIKNEKDQYIGQIYFGSKYSSSFDHEMKYSNYLKALIIYDKCLEFINNLNEIKYDDKGKLLKLYQEETSKKKLIIGTKFNSSPHFIIIFWHFLHHLTKTPIEKLSFFDLLFTNYILGKPTLKSSPTFQDVTNMIENGKLPYEKPHPAISSSSAMDELRSEVIQSFKNQLIQKIHKIYGDIEKLNEPGLQLTEDLTEEKLTQIVPARYKLLGQVHNVVDEILKKISSLDDKIKLSFDEDEKALTLIEEALREEMTVIYYNATYKKYLSILIEKEISLGSNSLTFEELLEKFQGKRRTPDSNKALRKFSDVINFVASLKKYLA